MADASEADEDHKSAKSVKRVRFSDEVKRVEILGESDDSSLSLENENSSVFPTSIEMPDDGESEDSKSNSSTSENNESEPFLGPDDNNNNELLDYPNNVTVTLPSSPIICDSVQTESVAHCGGNLEVKTVDSDESSQESPEMMDLIHETQSLTISPTSLAKLIPDSIVEIQESHPSISPEEKEKSEDQVKENKEIYKTPLSRKRSLEGVLLQKQSSKLNSSLRKNNSEIISADKLKDAVFKAWNEVKNEKNDYMNSSIHINSTVSSAEKSNIRNKQSSSKAYEMWKKSKIKSKKTNKSTESSLHSSQKSKSKQDIEESKMAFKAWKKKKDEIISHRLEEKYQKEAKEKFDSLMAEKTRKSEAESAFNAWRAHKSLILKLEKRKRQWVLEKDKEKILSKMKRCDEAAKVYQDWLNIKVCSNSNNSNQSFEDKPPWTPPGRGNS